MNRYIITLMMAVFSLMVHAADKDVTIKDGQKNPFYLQLYGGVNKSANENLPWTEFSKYPWSGGGFVGLGREFSQLWGWRVALRLNHNKSRNVQRCESSQTWGWNNLGLFGDITYDLTDAFAAKDKRGTQRFNLNAFLGIGAAYTFGFDDVPLSYSADYSRNSRVVPGARIGLNASWRLTRTWRLGVELSHSIYADRFNGVKEHSPIDERTNLNVGVAYVFRGKKKQTKTHAPIVYANPLRETSALVLPYILPKEESTKKRTISGRAFLDFPVNETVINPQYRRNPQELKRISETIDNALFDKTMQVTSISLHGYASPESPLNNNTRLAKGRTAALMEFLCKKYKVPASLFHNEYTPEDWHNLRGFIANSERRRVKGDLWYDDASVLETPEMPDYVLTHKEEMLQIIDQDIDVDEKENLLKKVAGGEPYKWLLRYVYPGLRHTDYIIEYVVRNYPISEARRLIYTHPEALSVEEMYRVAQSYEEGSDGWLDALLIAAKEYPDDKAANLNAACACVKAKRLTDAKRFLQTAGEEGNTKYLRDVIDAMEGKCKWHLENGKVILDNE